MLAHVMLNPSRRGYMHCMVHQQRSYAVGVHDLLQYCVSNGVLSIISDKLQS